MSRCKVLSTKKLDPALLRQLTEIEITEREFIAIQPVANETIQKQLGDNAIRGNGTVAFTSRHAVEAVNDYLKEFTGKNPGWSIFCLAGATKEAVRHSFFFNGTIRGEGDNASELASKIIDAGIQEILFFCGSKRRDELPLMLQQQGIGVQEVIVYDTLETPSVIAGGYDAVLFFSPSAVKSFFSVNQLSPGTVCFAIGSTTAAAIAQHTKNKIITSNSPHQEAMLLMVQLYFKNINCYE